MTETLAPRWLVAEREPEAESALCSELNLHPITAALLYRRGFRTPDAASKFLGASLNDFHDPSLLPDYEPASKILLEAIENKDRIYVHGDYDVDGVTSAAIFSRFFDSVKANHYVHVPHRVNEGYGVHESAVRRAVEQRAKIFLTCDCGVGAVEQVAAVKALGMKAIVTDHHEPGDILPKADALINPHLHDSTYPFDGLSGAGVVFKLCAGLTRDMGLPVDKFYRGFLDLAVLGTVADIMPLIDENRIIAKHGLVQLKQTRKLGLQALLRYSVQNADRELTTTDIGFGLGPRLNAAGRLDDAAHSLQLLVTRDPEESERLALMLEQINLERRSEQLRAVEEAIAWIEEQGLSQRNVLVAHNPNWHPGLVGLIAGKLVERFYRPAFALTSTEDMAKGSARSIPGFNLYQAIQEHMGILAGGGGHEMAAGISLKVADIQAFSDAVHEYAGRVLEPDDFVPKVTIDAEILPGELTVDLISELSQLEPYGAANPRPSFLARDMKVRQLSLVGPEKQHLKLQLEDAKGMLFGAIMFGGASRAEMLGANSIIDVIGEVQIDSYNGIKPQWRLTDFRAR